MFISILDRSGGFFSCFFFTMNHYLSCKLRGHSFILNTEYWLFKAVNGWTDYFAPIDFIGEHDDNELYILKHYQTADPFSLHDYKNIIQKMYIYNDATKLYIIKEKMALGLDNKQYGSIFIRRGDKLSAESKYIPTEAYLDILLLKSPGCKTIFLQTDDYNCFLDLKQCVFKKGLSIEVITMCHENNKGMVIFDHNLTNGLEKAIYSNEDNKEYLSTVMEDLRNAKPVNQMDSPEIYQHTMEMIIGIDIVLGSQLCVCDYQSNVSRFIKLAHPTSSSVYDVLNPDLDIDMNQTLCPAFGNFRDGKRL